jgi:DNA-binding protein Fis
LANQEKINVQIEDIVAELSGDSVDFTAVVDKAMHEIKKRIIDGAVRTCGGNRSRAAKRLGISRFKLIREEKKINGAMP